MSNELITVDNLTPPEVFKADKVTELLSKIEERIKEFVPCETTPAGLAEIDEFAWKITKSKTLLKKMGDDYAKFLKEEPKKVDRERKRIEDTLEGWAKQVRKPVTDREDAEKARIAVHEACIVDIGRYAMLPTHFTVADIEQNILNLKRFCANHTWEEFMSRATAEYTRVSQALTVILDDQKKKDADHAELARLRAEEEERNREKREAEIAANAKRLAEEIAEQERHKASEEAARAIRAEQDRLLAAEQALVDAENKRVADLAKAEKDKEAALQKQKDDAAVAKKIIDDATAQREADVEHKDKVNHAAILAILDMEYPTITAEIALVIVTAIAGGKIPNVSIKY